MNRCLGGFVRLAGFFCRVSLPAAFLVLLCAAAAPGQGLVPGKVAVCVDNGNNLREFGGPNYKNAAILGTLDAGDWVRVIRQEGRWAEVARYDGVRGFVNAACLTPVEKYIAAQKNQEDFVCAPDMPRRFEVDLGGGQGRGAVVLRDVPDLFGGGATMEVVAASGETLWKGPAADVYDAHKPVSPLTFYCHHSGVSWPELIGDVSGDGRPWIIAPVGQSDVSVSSFNAIRWTGTAFEPVFAGLSLVEKPRGSGKFVFEKYEGDSRGERWIMSFGTWRGQGLAEANVYEYVSGGRGENAALLFGKALVRLTPSGAEAASWPQPMRSSE
jgi:hypothetical protein